MLVVSLRISCCNSELALGQSHLILLSFHHQIHRHLAAAVGYGNLVMIDLVKNRVKKMRDSYGLLYLYDTKNSGVGRDFDSTALN